MKEIKGHIFILGDDINTDDIIPSHTLTLRDPEEMSKYTLQFVAPEFAKNLNKYKIIIAGENFGTGSSREEAVNVFKILGIKAIIAKSFARIYFRNLINLGIPAIKLKWKEDHFSKGDFIQINLSQAFIYNQTKNLKFEFEQLPNFLKEILNQGGIINKLIIDLKK
ncbi:MAG: 3-isopropylmalate dehydratase [Candidatus Thorarchaeota archaeon]